MAESAASWQAARGTGTRLEALRIENLRAPARGMASSHHLMGFPHRRQVPSGLLRLSPQSQ